MSTAIKDFNKIDPRVLTDYIEGEDSFLCSFPFLTEEDCSGLAKEVKDVLYNAENLPKSIGTLLDDLNASLDELLSPMASKLTGIPNLVVEESNILCASSNGFNNLHGYPKGDTLNFLIELSLVEGGEIVLKRSRKQLPKLKVGSVLLFPGVMTHDITSQPVKSKDYLRIIGQLNIKESS